MKNYAALFSLLGILSLWGCSTKQVEEVSPLEQTLSKPEETLSDSKIVPENKTREKEALNKKQDERAKPRKQSAPAKEEKENRSKSTSVSQPSKKRKQSPSQESKASQDLDSRSQSGGEGRNPEHNIGAVQSEQRRDKKVVQSNAKGEKSTNESDKRLSEESAHFDSDSSEEVGSLAKRQRQPGTEGLAREESASAGDKRIVADGVSVSEHANGEGIGYGQGEKGEASSTFVRKRNWNMQRQF